MFLSWCTPLQAIQCALESRVASSDPATYFCPPTSLSTHITPQYMAPTHLQPYSFHFGCFLSCCTCLQALRHALRSRVAPSDPATYFRPHTSLSTHIMLQYTAPTHLQPYSFNFGCFLSWCACLQALRHALESRDASSDSVSYFRPPTSLSTHIMLQYTAPTHLQPYSFVF